MTRSKTLWQIIKNIERYNRGLSLSRTHVKLGKIAKQRCITRTELMEELLSLEYVDIDEVVKILKEALILKANAGGAIKEKIKKVLSKLIS